MRLLFVFLILPALAFSQGHALYNQHQTGYQEDYSSSEPGITLAEIGENLWSCGKNAVTGAIDGSIIGTVRDVGGMAISAGQATWDCFWSPLECAGKAYNAASEAMGALKEMATKTMHTLSNMGSILASIPGSVISDVTCNLGAGILAGILTTGGVGAAKKAIPGFLITLAKTLPRLAKIAKMIGSAGGKIITKIHRMGEEQAARLEKIMDQLRSEGKLKLLDKLGPQLEACTL